MMNVYLAQIVRFDAWFTGSQAVEWYESEEYMYVCECCGEKRELRICNERKDLHEHAVGSYLCLECYLTDELAIVGVTFKCIYGMWTVLETSDITHNNCCELCDMTFTRGWHCINDSNDDIQEVCIACVTKGIAT